MSNELSDQKISETLNAIPKATRENGTINYRALGILLGIDERNAGRRVKRLAEKGLVGFAPVMAGFVVKKVSSQLDADGAVQKTFVQQAREPGATFVLPEGHAVKGVSALLDADNRVVAQWVKTNKEAEKQAELVEALKATFESYQGRAELAPAPEYVDGDLLTLFAIGDQHHAMMAWKDETGANYDLKISQKNRRDEVKKLR